MRGFNKYSFLFLFYFYFIFSACLKTEFTEQELTSGNADFSRYVAVGNSLTQGYQNGGLHNEKGEHDNSYPAILASQMKLVSPALNFVQPQVNGSGSGHLHLAWRNNEIEVIKAYDPNLTPQENDYEAIGDDPSWVNFADKNLSYSNLGVSGIKLANLCPGGNTSANLNYFFYNVNEYARFLNWGTPSNMITYLDHIKASNATFFTCWLGNNDVLGWSTEGGDDGYEAQFNQSFYKLTDVTEFHDKYDSVLTAFTRMGAKGVCATIPDVTSIPYFNTVTLEEVDRDVWIVEGPYSNNPGNVRLATNEDLILLTAVDSLDAGEGDSPSNPLSHTLVLDKDEKTMSQNASNAYNTQIKQLAAQYGFPVADMHQFMGELKSGLVFDGVEFDARFVEGGAFSLDGVHPNNRGYAIIANKFIETINQYYGSNLPTVEVSNYQGIIFP